MPLTRPYVLIAAAGVLASCHARFSPESAIEVVFEVASDRGLRLSNVPVELEGKALGNTNSNGVLRAKIDGKPGQRLRVECVCPPGHTEGAVPKFFRIRPLNGIGESQRGALKVTLRCKLEKRLAVFIVRANNGAGLPVLLNGHTVAHTNSEGVAQFSASAPPGTDFVVKLDTQGQPDLIPQHPTHLRMLSDADDIFVVHQSFDHQKVPLPRKRRRMRITKIE